MPDPVALSDTWTWRGPVDRSSSVQLSRVINDVPPRESTTSGSNVCEWVASPNSSSGEYGSDLDDAITMSLSEYSSGDGGSGGGRGTGSGLGRGDARNLFDENLASPQVMAPRSGAGRLNAAETPHYRRGGGTATHSSTWAPFCGSVRVKGAAFIDQHEAAAAMVQQPARLRPSETNSASRYTRPRQGHRSSLPARQLPHFFPDDGSSSSSDDILEHTQAGIWDYAAKTAGAAQKRQSEGRRGSIDNYDIHPGRQNPRGLLAKPPCAAIGILRGRDERRRRQRQQREQQRLRQMGPELGRSDSDQEQAWGCWARNAGLIRHASTESLEISPGSSPILLSPLNCRTHAFEKLRSACLSAETMANANDDSLFEHDDSEGSARGTTTTSYFPSTMISSTGELLRHRTVTRGSSAERLPEDGLQRADPSAAQELLLCPVENMVPGKENPVSTIAGSRWGIRLMVATDPRAATVAAAAAERQSLVECSGLNPAGADSSGSVAGFGSMGLRLRDGVVAVAREPKIVDPAAASTVDDIPHGSLATIAAPPSISVGVASADAIAETNAELAPPRHVGGGGGSVGGGGIEKQEIKARKNRRLDNGRGFGYRYDHDYDVFRARWSPRGGRGGEGGGEVGPGGGKGQRGGRGGGGGAGTSGARNNHRRCGTVKGPGRSKSIWPSSPTSSQQQKTKSGPCPRRGMIWGNDDNGTSVICWAP